jgi:membrane protein implicated in regulation of membrane protease activity
MNLILHLGLCASLAVALVAVYLYRHWLENHDDPYIHLHNDSHDSNIIQTQTVLGKRLEVVDRVKNGLLVAVIVYAVAIAAMGVFLAWNNTGS